MGQFDKIAQKFINVVSIVAAAILCFMVALCTMGVILRYAFSVSFQWTEEVIRYGQVFITLSLVGALLYTGGHISMDMLLVKAKGPVRTLMALFGAGLTAFVTIYACYFGIRWVGTLIEMKILTNSGVFMQYQPSLLEPIGMGISAVFAILVVIKLILEIKRKSMPHGQDALPEERGQTF